MARVSSRFWLWRLPASVAVLASLLFATGFWLALRGATGRPLGVAPPPPAGKALPAVRPSGRLLLVLGDSLAHGTGDETGKGFATDVFEALRKRDGAEIANLAVDGAESSELRDLLEKENVRRLAASAAWILVSVGGNDLTHAAPGLEGSPASPLEELSRARASYAANLRTILATLREANPSAPIRVLGLYNPFEDRAGASRVPASVLRGWNSVIQETAQAFPEVLVVPTFDLFEYRQDRLALDHFHPNRAGYSLIAARILQDLE